MGFRKKKASEEPLIATDDLEVREDIAARMAAVDALEEENKKSFFEKRREKREKKPKKKVSFRDFPFLQAIKPREFYTFHSDYFQVDDRFCTIMSFFHMPDSSQAWGAFWGVDRIPSGLSNDVQIMIFDQCRRQTNRWIQEHQDKSETITQANTREQQSHGTNTNKVSANQKEMDILETAKELANGAAYVQMQTRLYISAPSLDALEEVVKHIDRLYTDRFSTLRVDPYYGEQRKELSQLFVHPVKRLGDGFYMTSTELAGSYSLVTHGVEDPGGEYVGDMIGDVNNAAVLFDTNGYRHSVVVADEDYDDDKDRTRITSLWGSKLSQSCLLDGNRVVHLILDGTNLDNVGPKFSNLTYKIDLNKGDVNMFEMFGKRKDQLSIFSTQMQKLILMAEQAYECTDSDRAIIRGSLEAMATQFYIDKRMWYHNAKDRNEDLRVVGIPHEQVPKLEDFVTYVTAEYDNVSHKSARDDEYLHAVSVLRMTFQNLLSNNGDLFNTTTSKVIDGAEHGQRVIYDFSSLMQRGLGVAMAQLVNIIGYAVSNVRLGDTLIIHGVERISDEIKEYVSRQIDRIYDAGGRVVFLYNSIDKMLADNGFCGYDRADYKIFGHMTVSHIDAYQKAVGQDVPAVLRKVIVNSTSSCNYIQRNFDNIVFERKLILNRPGEEEVDNL